MSNDMMDILQSTAPDSTTYLPAMPFMNRLFGGGLPEGKLIGLVGPTGGGKTLLAMQVAHAMLSVEKRVLYLGFELQNDIRGRLRKLGMGAYRENFSPEVRGRREQKLVRDHRRFCLKEGADLKPLVTPDCLGTLLGTEAWKADLVVVDQLGTWLMGNKKKIISWNIDHYCAELKKVAAHTGIPILLLHQLKGSLNAGPAIRRPTWSDAGESKSFGSDGVDVGVFIGRKNETGCCWISCPKLNRHELVWLDGENARFRGLGRIGDYYEADRHTSDFELTAEAEASRLEFPSSVVSQLHGGCGPEERYKPQDYVFIEEPRAATGTDDNKEAAIAERSAVYSEPPQAMGEREMELFLTASSWGAGVLTDIHGMKMISALGYGGEQQHVESLIRFVLWCRCYYRRDFINLLSPNPALNALEIMMPMDETVITRFKGNMLQEAKRAGWDEGSITPGFVGKIQGGDGFKRLIELHSSEFAEKLKTLYQTRRQRFLNKAKTAAEYSDGHTVVAIGYYKQHNKPEYWQKALKPFLEKNVSPLSFFADMASGYNAIPWPEAFPELVKTYARSRKGGDGKPLPVHYSDRNDLLRHLMDDEMMPWELGLGALNASGLGIKGLGFVPQHCWSDLAWAMIGRCSDPKTEEDLRALSQQATSG